VKTFRRTLDLIMETVDFKYTEICAISGKIIASRVYLDYMKYGISE